MTLGSKPLTKRAGEFYARCNLSRPHPIKDLPHYLRREYEAAGWPKGIREVYDRKARRALFVECFLEPLCAGFETRDASVFEQHMKEVHRKASVRGIWEPTTRSVRAGWRSPRLKPEGQEVKGLEVLQTCPSCGLMAEVDDTAASVLWWDEHLRGCAIAAAQESRTGAA